MWSCDRRTFAAGLLAALAGCGFEPLLAPGGGASAARGRVAVEGIGGEIGYTLRRRLIARLGPEREATHRLSVRVALSSQGIAVSTENAITRYNVTAVATWRLVAVGGGVADRGETRAFAAYNATASPFATRAAARDAQERLALTLADRIATRLAVSAPEWAR